MGKVKYESFKLIRIRPFYTVTEGSRQKTFNTLKEIATNYNTSILKIHRLLEEGHKYSELDHLKIEKEPFPYIYEFDGDEYESESEQDIVKTTGISKTHVGHLVKKYKLHIN